jgi:hypothetical protein
MNVGHSVRKAIDDMGLGETDAAMLHACNAVDGTAKKLHASLGSNARFTQVLRDNYGVLGPMGMPGVDLAGTRFPVHVERPKAQGGQPDLADVIYGIHRCCHGHGEELPQGFELLPDAAGPARMTRFEVEQGKVRLSDRVIFALIAVAVLSPVNQDQRVPDRYFLTFGVQKLPINAWWGRATDFTELLKTEPLPSVRLDFGDWMGS